MSKSRLIPTPAPIVSEDDDRTGGDVEAKLRALQQERSEACRAEIARVLQRHQCILQGVPQFTPAGNGAWVITVSIGVAPAPG